MLEDFPLYMETCYKHLRTHEAACGLDDAPLAHWERVVRSARLTRAQVRRALWGRLLESSLQRPKRLEWGLTMMRVCIHSDS